MAKPHTLALLWLFSAALLLLLLAAWGQSPGFALFACWLWCSLTVRHDNRLSFALGLLCLGLIPFLLMAGQPALAETTANTAYALFAAGIAVRLQEIRAATLNWKLTGHHFRVGLHDLPSLCTDLVVLTGSWYIAQGLLGCRPPSGACLPAALRPEQVALLILFSLLVLLALGGYLYPPPPAHKGINPAAAASLILLPILGLLAGSYRLIEMPLLQPRPLLLFALLSWLLLAGRRRWLPAAMLQQKTAWVVGATTLVTLAGLLAGLARPTRPATVQTVSYDLAAGFASASTGQTTQVAVEQWPAGGEPLTVLTVQTPAGQAGRLTYRLTPSPGAVFRFSLAIRDGTPGAEATFQVGIEQGNTFQTLFEERVAAGETELVVHGPFAVDLSTWAGQAIDLTLAADTQSRLELGWVAPVIVAAPVPAERAPEAGGR